MAHEAPSEAVIRDVEQEEFQKLIASDSSVRVIDVRTPAEFDEGHIEGADLMNIYDPAFPDAIARLDRSVPYGVYCRSGSRSADAAHYMQQLGFTTVYNLADGLLGWSGPLVD